MAFKKVNVTEPDFESLRSGWEDKLLMNEMTVLRDGLGAVAFETKRAQPKQKPRGWDDYEGASVRLGPHGRF